MGAKTEGKRAGGHSWKHLKSQQRKGVSVRMWPVRHLANVRPIDVLAYVLDLMNDNDTLLTDTRYDDSPLQSAATRHTRQGPNASLKTVTNDKTAHAAKHGDMTHAHMHTQM